MQAAGTTAGRRKRAAGGDDLGAATCILSEIGARALAASSKDEILVFRSPAGIWFTTDVAAARKLERGCTDYKVFLWWRGIRASGYERAALNHGFAAVTCYTENGGCDAADGEMSACDPKVKGIDRCG